MLDEDFKQILIDRFEAFELVEFLQVPLEELIDGLEKYIIENKEELNDLIGFRNDEDE